MRSGSSMELVRSDAQAATASSFFSTWSTTGQNIDEIAYTNRGRLQKQDGDQAHSYCPPSNTESNKLRRDRHFVKDDAQTEKYLVRVYAGVRSSTRAEIVDKLSLLQVVSPEPTSILQPFWGTGNDNCLRKLMSVGHDCSHRNMNRRIASVHCHRPNA